MKHLLLVLCVVLLAASQVPARTWYILPDGKGDVTNIGAGLDSAAVGDTLLLASGTFTGEGNRDLAIPDKNVVIMSETGNPDDCVIDCEGEFGFIFESGSAVIKGLTMTNGVWSALRVWTWMSGGSIDLTVKDCTFSNWEGDGGAMNIECLGEVTIRRCKFLSNVGGMSGAVYICAEAYLEVLIDGCTFCGNTAYYGSAITCTVMEGSTYISNSVFCHNSAERSGGAIDKGEASPGITGCTFFANSAPLGSAISGGIYGGCTRCILAYGTGGCPIYVDDPFSDPVVSCTNIYGNEGGDWVGCIAGQDSMNGNLWADPRFCDPQADDLRLDESSPCAPSNSPNGCGLIGALPVGCASAGVPSKEAESTTWGAIKAMYRQHSSL